MSADFEAKATARQELHRPTRSSRQRATATALVACTAVILPLAACGAGKPPADAAARKTCAQVRAVLSNGPDPGQDAADSSAAQILPLRQVHSSNPALRSAIGKLAAAYDRFFASDGKSATAASAVAAAAAHLNKLCPGTGAAA